MTLEQDGSWIPDFGPPQSELIAKDVVDVPDGEPSEEDGSTKQVERLDIGFVRLSGGRVELRAVTEEVDDAQGGYDLDRGVGDLVKDGIAVPCIYDGNPYHQDYQRRR